MEVSHSNRVFGFALLFVMLGVHMLGKGYGRLTWVRLALPFVVYPQMLYWRTRASARPRDTEMQHMLLDSLAFGVWAAYPGDGTSPELLIGNADRALSRAKEGGATGW